MSNGSDRDTLRAMVGKACRDFRTLVNAGADDPGLPLRELRWKLEASIDELNEIATHAHAWHEVTGVCTVCGADGNG